MLAEKFHREALIGGCVVETEPDEMGVVGHEHVGGAGEVPASAGVEERELPRVVKRGGKPASRAVVEGRRPEYAGSAAVEFGSEAREVAGDGLLALAATFGRGIHHVAASAERAGFYVRKGD